MDISRLESVGGGEVALSQQVADQIMQLILDQHLSANDRLPSEFDLAAKLGVGRGTVREAVKLLVSRNVLVIRRGKGTFIADSPGEISDPLGFAFIPNQLQLAFDLLEIRMQLEPWAASLAAERRTAEELDRLQAACSLVEEEILEDRNYLPHDVEFHVRLAECVHNQALPKLVPVITYAVHLFGSITDRSLRFNTLQEHRQITDAVAARNGEQAAAVMRKHMESNRQELEAVQREMGTFREQEKNSKEGPALET